ncbi:MAG: hypothetical protein HWE10_15600 [Gammaproteobacteria bacterium]|nr:hypothetical protein [Gammaproteobacteria bacterium]
MKSVKLLSSFFVAVALSGCVIHVNAQRADVELQETLTLNSQSLTRFDLETGAGSLEVVGVKSASEITVDAQIRTTEDRNYILTLEKSGDTAELVAKHESHTGYWKGSSPAIDLVISVPSHLLVNIDDGSGDIKVRDLDNQLTIEDGSGSASVENIKGNVDIDDGSGSLLVRNVDGNVRIDDGSGELSIAQVTGDVMVEDGSGDLNVYDVGGSVVIDDGSGSIDVNKAGGLEIIESGSGGLNINNVVGAVNIDD